MKKRILVWTLLLWVGLGPLGAQPGEDLTVAGDLTEMVDRYLAARFEETREERRRRIEEIGSAEQAEVRREFIRRTLVESMGGFPEKTPLNARVTGVLERDGYRVEHLVYESLPGFYVTANVYVPTDSQPPFPAVLGTAGHALSGKASPVYQRAWISMARRGFLVVAYDPMGQGERLEYFDPILGRSRVGSPTREHTSAGLQCLLTGTHLARYELWDGVRAVDYLLERGDVDPERIAVAGNSGGGTQSAYLAVVEPRLAAVVSSCYMTSWDELWYSPGPQDAEQNFVGFLSDGLDFSDFAIAFAPRPFKILAAIQDYFPIEGARRAYREARRFYELLGSPEAIGIFEYDDGHGWSQPRREATYRWLDRWLKDRRDEGREEPIVPEPEEELWVTTTGQLSTSLGGETVFTLNRALADEIHPRRTAAGIGDGRELGGLVASTLGTRFHSPSIRSVPRAERRGEIGRDGYRIERILLETEPGVQVPSLMFIPSDLDGPRPGLLYVHSSGKGAEATRGGDIEALVREGYAVLAPDLRGWGESAGPPGRGGYTPEYQTVQRALLLGRTLVGMQVDDLLACLEYLLRRPEVVGDQVSLMGGANGGVVALLAAALEPRFHRVAVERSVLSYRRIVRAPIHEGTTSIIVPGILKEFDLPDVAAALAPRRLWIVDPRSPTAARLPLEEAEEEFRSTGRAFQEAGGEGEFRILGRPDGWEFSRVYREWLQ